MPTLDTKTEARVLPSSHFRTSEAISPADMWENCAIDDTSMKFGTVIEHSTRKIF